MPQDRPNLICSSWLVFATVLALMIICTSTIANAQAVGEIDQTASIPNNASPLPKVLEGVGYQQRIGSQIPLDATFTDETGKTVPLRTYFGKVPVVLILAYYRCPMLCSQVMSGATAAFKQVGFQIGDQFNVLTVSFDPRDTPDVAAKTKQTYMQQYGDPKAVAGWHFLTGKEPQIKELTDAVGFHYNYDPKTGMFAHAAGILVLTPDGKAAQYFYGVGFVDRDLRLALVQSSQNKLGSIADQILLFCCTYDPGTGKYQTIISRVLKLAAAITILAIGLGLLCLRGTDLTGGREGTGPV
jgi:protein SCO1/2